MSDDDDKELEALTKRLQKAMVELASEVAQAQKAKEDRKRWN